MQVVLKKIIKRRWLGSCMEEKRSVMCVIQCSRVKEVRITCNASISAVKVPGLTQSMG